MQDIYMFESPIGVLELIEEDGSITNLYLKYGKDLPIKSCKPHSDLIYEAYKQINEYFAGKRMVFELPLNLKGTIFQQKVWHELQNIPYGETRSYQDIAISIDNEKAVRAVGQANNRNPVIIIVPCHRVINKNGTIGGFGCGIETKKYLLGLEQRITLCKIC